MLRPLDELTDSVKSGFSVVFDGGEPITTEEALREEYARQGAARDARATPPAIDSPPPAIDLPMPQSTLDALVSAGYDTPEKIAAASDDQLKAVPGVGDATVAKLRQTQGA